MKRGEIYYANLSPTVGSEIDKRRPVLVVSNDANNRAANTVTILPITSNITRIYPFEVLLNPEDSGLSKSSKVQAQQIRTISKQRITSDAVGSLNEEIMQLVNIALKLHLDVD
ncbi:MAG: type II toxin-antitoxin system PemK/MazF family toxin [Microcoleus sp. PH2017_29_MFU_D_A]|uniref:type II toxin-antitoxin system PemK/MazF family toxin n=1 Tax=unclassified Microcoleus TaxID=2642155 RepID=UPI001DEE7508|nr:MULTISPECIES: type II toxin-antitoxin system PemK/MazF family toxin [unclassified Microcoleus]MCC3511069.1 type II toxin-antitoxin system PemK/MazF family toxin [Microcoleus sp. PH2017_17_BER_D_A]TAE08542.1 MAG: type II toxin-antitoxin system PemK/MazF family toxin [Oscillatoriales cyanobacterium]MCC3415473.1 type II toxin-antitoxin system PemK/MazF family toxin [Microcoleus sp. PH2017_02_FOX_O_A]MCC3426847.1 type II toxin-antitoxin system PemK/MazF family toxin [Microcoleus sp. PH2017_01_SC